MFRSTADRKADGDQSQFIDEVCNTRRTVTCHLPVRSSCGAQSAEQYNSSIGASYIRGPRGGEPGKSIPTSSISALGKIIVNPLWIEKGRCPAPETKRAEQFSIS